MAQDTVWDCLPGVRTRYVDERTPVNHLSKATDIITFPARTAIGVTSLGLRTTVRVLGWAAEHAFGQGPVSSTPTVRVPDARPTRPDVDPMAPTRTPPTPPPARKSPARKVPAGQVPLKSAPTPSLPQGVEAIDDAAEAAAPAPRTRTATKTAGKKTAAKKTAAKKTAAKKTTARKAPSKQAAVLAPALGLSEDEVTQLDKG